jgi:hypothetical protein
MASSINASTSGAGGVITTADNTGTLQLQSGGTTIATISSTGITTQVGAPAFSAYANATQSIANSTFTKVLFQVEEFDTNSNFASSRFTPTVAGYYQVNSAVYIQAISNQALCSIYKNGVLYKNSPYITGNGGDAGALVSAIVYLNGTTDYIELYANQNSGSTKTIYGVADSPQITWFNAAMIRSA